MTTQAPVIEVTVEYQSAVPTAGGPDAADFTIRRPSQATLECALYLALDAKQAFEQRCGALPDDAVQRVIRALADVLYPEFIADGAEPPAIWTVRARDLGEERIAAVIAAAGLTPLEA